MEFGLAVIKNWQTSDYLSYLDYIQDNAGSIELVDALYEKYMEKFSLCERCAKAYEYRAALALDTEPMEEVEYVVFLDEMVEFVAELNISEKDYVLMQCSSGSFFNIDKILNDSGWKKYVKKSKKRIDGGWWKVWLRL